MPKSSLKVAIGILAIAAGLVWLQLFYGRHDPNCNLCHQTIAENDVQNIATQLQMYKTVAGAFPSTAQGLDALVTPPIGNPRPNKWRRIMDAVPLDPWGNPYQFRNLATKSNREIDVFSMGPDGLPDTEDDIGDW